MENFRHGQLGRSATGRLRSQAKVSTAVNLNNIRSTELIDTFTEDRFSFDNKGRLVLKGEVSKKVVEALDSGRRVYVTISSPSYTTPNFGGKKPLRQC